MSMEVTIELRELFGAGQRLTLMDSKGIVGIVG